jgi:Cys-tRNA(Pro)/Cys-tRNA(Cys) deacylase
VSLFFVKYKEICYNPAPDKQRRQAVSTKAAVFLKHRNILFELVKYEHGKKGAQFAASATGFPLEKLIKTLVVDLGKGNYVLALMPGTKQLDLKKIAGACSAKRAAMADTLTAERLTGYLVGGISPFATKHNIPVVMEKSLMNHDQVMINAGQRGVMLVICPADIVKALDRCVTADIAVA